MRKFLALCVPMAVLAITGCDGGGDDNNEQPSCSVYVALPITIDTDTVLDGCYVADGSVTVTAALTIMPGTTVEFPQDTYLWIYTGGSLNAVGTAADPILLTGEQKTPGYWQGVFFDDSDDVDNDLAFVTIEYGGSDSGHPANLIVQAGSRVSVTDVTLRRSSGFGLHVDNGSVIDAFARNHLTLNASGAATMDVNMVGYLDDTSTYTGNTVDIVEMHSGTLDRTQTWPGIDAEYVVSDAFYVSADLTIEPGAVLQMASGTFIEVESAGSLHAQGSAAHQILFTGVQGTRGYWDGLWYTASDDDKNVLDYVIVEYGGGWDTDSANLIVRNGARVVITNSALQESSAYGLHAHDNAILTGFANNVLTLNDVGAANIDANLVGYLDEASTYSGNVDDIVNVLSTVLSEAQTWPGIDADYFVSASFDVTAAWTISPGAWLVFDSNTYVDVTTGSLNAVGTALDPITFAGAQATSAYWQGLYFRTNDTANELGYVNISEGGAFASTPANVILYTDAATLNMHDSTLSNAPIGIWVATGASLTQSNNIFDTTTDIGGP